jgi:hypothetical protein
MNNTELKSNLLSSKHWLRLIFMLLFAVVLQLTSLIMWALVILQFLFSLITGQDNHNLRRFGQSLSRYIFDTLRFLTYNSEQKPFPFADWPSDEATPPPASQTVTTNAPKRSRARPAKPVPPVEGAPDTGKDA